MLLIANVLLMSMIDMRATPGTLVLLFLISVTINLGNEWERPPLGPGAQKLHWFDVLFQLSPMLPCMFVNRIQKTFSRAISLYFNGLKYIFVG